MEKQTSMPHNSGLNRPHRGIWSGDGWTQPVIGCRWGVTLGDFFLKTFIYLAVPGLSCGTKIISCGMWNLVSWPGIEPGPPALRAWSLSHWTTREVLWGQLFGEEGCCWEHRLQIFPAVPMVASGRASLGDGQGSIWRATASLSTRGTLSGRGRGGSVGGSERDSSLSGKAF